MSRKKTVSPQKKIAVLVGAAALVGGAAFAMAGTSQAGTNQESVTCQGLSTALGNNQEFIAGQQANPDANSAARIANRQQVIQQIEAQRKAAGCTEGGEAAAPPEGQAPPEQGGAAAPGGEAAGGEEAGNGQAQGGDQAGGEQAGDGQAEGGGQAAGEVVCEGSTVTLSGEAGAPAASSGDFPVGTQLKVTNLDNDQSVTVEVTSTSGSCALLNNAAFEEVREPGKNLIRNARIERVG
ncbi:hypothetical protein [Streptomyces sp. NPDC047108]|uniref:hypothetical protein n=1 Tax=Streptomyces sp. NPDC047108 TaxID=3155025 RepID=UPI0033E4FC5E